MALCAPPLCGKQRESAVGVTPLSSMNKAGAVAPGGQGSPPPHWAACPGEACAGKVGVGGPRGRSATPPQPPPPAAASRLPVRGCSAPRGGDAEGGRGGRARRGAHSTLLRARLEPRLPAALGGQCHV